MSFVPLWCKSHFSFLEGASHPDELVRTARDLGLPALAVTDRDGVYGIVRAHVAAREAGFKLIVGSEISIDGGCNVVLLVQNLKGYRNLCSLITIGRRRSPKGESRVSWNELYSCNNGLVAVIPAGPNRSTPEGISDSIPWEDLKNAFLDSLYIGYARHQVLDDIQELLWVEHQSSRGGIPIVAFPELLYHSIERRPLQDVLTCIRHGKTLESAGDVLKVNHHHGLLPPDQFASLYSETPDAVLNTMRIARSCHFSMDDIKYRYPTEKHPRGYSVMQWLEELVWQGTAVRYPLGVPGNVRQQIRRELDIIEKLEYGGYFLTMREIVRFCREKGILCQGRGSAANSIVCYCLDITAIDPVQMDLLFERFLSLERAEPPDIDLDIEHQRREEVIQHMYSKYGRERAAMVANFIRYRPKSAVRDVGKVLGFSSASLERLAKNLGTWWEDPRRNLEQSLEKEPGGKSGDFLSGAADRNELLSRLCREILEFPRHLSIHPGGFILGSQPIANLVPVENATMPDRTVIQWDKYDVEAMNLFKVDLLGLGALSHLDHTMKLLKKHGNIEVSLQDISRSGDDADVYQALCKGDTVGVFQVESRAQMAMLPRLKPRRFYDLVIEVSIVRPGPISGGMVHPYLRRRNGEEPLTYPHPSLEPVLKKTLGVPLFQEQVMKLAVVAADYSPGEADQLRRDMGAWKSSSRLAMHREKLIGRMVKKGIREDFAEAVYNQIQGFGEYGFPESHAASFALIAYATAWFKVKYPAFFTCGLLNAWPMGFYTPATIVDDAKRHNIPILSIDVTISDWDCTPELCERDSNPVWGVRMGLKYVKGLSRSQGDIITGLRNEGINNIDSFAARSGIGVKMMKALTLCGAFDSYSDNRRSQLWHSLLRHGSLEEDEIHWGYFENDPVVFDPLSRFETIDWDYSGSFHSSMGHPVEAVRKGLEELGIPDSREVRSRKDGSFCTYAGLVICRQRPGTANGVIFITLEDEFGFVNLVVWQKVYEEYKEILLTRSLLGVRGKLQSRDGTVHLIANECFEPAVNMNGAVAGSRDFH